MSQPAAQVAERLLADGKITTDQYEGVLHHMQRTGMRCEEALLETSAINEADLLKYLAKQFGTRFVGTDKLARADVDPSTLALVPRKIAEKLQVFPVVYDGEQGILSVVSPDAGDADLAKQVQIASNVRDVRIYVARPAAVKAAIAKHYGGDIYAFANVDRAQVEQYASMMNVYERNMISEESLTSSIVSKEKSKERTLGDRDFERGAKKAESASGGGARAGQTNGVPYEDYVETLQVMVSLLENGRGELRGHSPLVARLIRKIAERIGVSAFDARAFAAAALLHDIGKSSTYHLTALNVAEYEGHRVAAEKSNNTPVRLFESVRLDTTTEAAIISMYERYDGKGFPDQLAGKDIPLGARLLSITDTYADLTQNSRNPFRKKLSPTEACDVLARYRGKVFDPNLVDLFKHTVLGDDLKARLLADRPAVLLVDADPEESTVLELRLLESGYDVLMARSPDSAIQIIEQGGAEVCISETDFTNASGFDLLRHARTHANGKDMPWVFLTRDSKRESVSKAFELGATDYVIKPVPNDVLVAKVKRMFENRGARAGRGVSGSLAEMGLPDIVQILAQGRKTGQLKIRNGNDAGEIHFETGAIVNAMYKNQRGEEAFYAMCVLDKGEFSLDPSFKPGARVIQASADALLLEGMRRFDEARG